MEAAAGALKAREHEAAEHVEASKNLRLEGAEDPDLVRMYLSVFRMRLESFLLNPPEKYRLLKVKMSEFEAEGATLNKIISIKARSFPANVRNALHAMKNAGNIGAHVEIFDCWLKGPAAMYARDVQRERAFCEANRWRFNLNKVRATTISAALRGCKLLGIDIPSSARAFFTANMPKACANAECDDERDDDEHDDLETQEAEGDEAVRGGVDAADGGGGEAVRGGVSAADGGSGGGATASHLDRVQKDILIHRIQQAEETLRHIEEFEKRVAGGGLPLIPAESADLKRKADLEAALAQNTAELQKLIRPMAASSDGGPR